MPTEELKRSTDVVRKVLSNQYGGASAIIGFVWLIATQKPTEYEQLKDFTAHVLSALNNPIGLCLAIYLLLIYFNKTFFKAYLEKETGYAATVKDFEGTLKSSLASCLTVSESVKQERTQVLERLIKIEGEVSPIVPKLDKLISYYEGSV